MKQKLFSIIALLLMAATGAYATEFTSLKVGDVLHVGDVINTGTNYTVYGAYLDAGSQPATLVRADISDPMTITESETGAYYFIKTKTDGYTGIIFGEGFEGGYWPVTDTSDGISVTAITPGDYGYTELTFAVHEGPATYKITVAEGTEDAENWDVPKEAAEGSPVTATYSGEKKVKSVKAVKKALDPAKAYLTWDKDQKQLVATEIPTTAIKVENSNENVSWAGTYVVEDDVTISGTIGLSGDVDLIIKDGATLTAQGIGGSGNNLRIYGQANQSGQLVVNRTNGDAIMNTKTLEVHSAQLTATSSTSSCGGIYGTTTFNVYGGSVDAKGTGAGYGISLNSGGSINIWGGEVKAEGKGTGSYSFGIRCGGTATVTVNGGKLWAENADKKALNGINLQKGDGFTGKIEYSSDKSTWSETVDANAKYVRAGY